MVRLFLYLVLVAISISAGAQVPAGIPVNGLVAWYPFNCDAKDLSVSRNNATVHGATLTADRFGNANSAWHFNGINDYISAPAIPALDFTNQLSISAWVRLDDYSLNSNGDPNRAIIGKQRSPNQTGFNTIAAGESLIYAFGLHNGVTRATDAAPDTLSLKVWHHIAAIYDGETMYLYKDGNLVHTSSFSITLAPSAQALCIGKEGAMGRCFKGSIDEVALWNRALTPAEVLEIYNSTGMIWGRGMLGTGKMITLAAAIPGGKWSSSSASIATIDAYGKVTGVSAGRATIWYSVDNECGDNSVIARMSFRVSSSLNISEEIPGKKVEEAPTVTHVKTWEKPPVAPSEVLSITEPQKMPVVLHENAHVAPHIIPMTAAVITSEQMPMISPVILHVRNLILRRTGFAYIVVPEIPVIEAPEEIPVVLPENKPLHSDVFSISVDPEREELMISSDTGAYTSVTIKDRTEKVQIKQSIKGAQTKVDISKLLPGSYYLLLEKDGVFKTTMFVKDK